MGLNAYLLPTLPIENLFNMTALESNSDSKIMKKVDGIERNVDKDDLAEGNEINSESGDSEEEEDDVKNKFGEIMADLKSCAKTSQVMSGTFDLATHIGVQAFIRKNKDDLGTVTPKKQTLLHLIAECERRELPHTQALELFIHGLVNMPENLLERQDDNGKTPLFCAITNKRHRLAKIMCNAHGDINSILKISKIPGASKSANCIHQAIMKKSSKKDDEFIKFLIQKADEDTLLAVDENELTPLHLAVEYQRCDDSQLSIIKALVEGCDKVLDMTYKHPEMGSLSPYLHHEITYQQAKRNEGQMTERKQNAEVEGVLKNERFGSKSNSNDKREPRKKKLGEPHTLEESIPSSFPQWESTYDFGPKQQMLERNRSFLPEATSMSNTKQGELLTPDKKSSSHKSRASKLKPTEADASEIKDYLKLEYLRRKKHDQAVGYLYGLQQGIIPKSNTSLPRYIS